MGPRGVAWAFLDLGAGCSSGWHSNESSKGSVYLIMPLKQAFLVRGRGRGGGIFGFGAGSEGLGLDVNAILKSHQKGLYI